MRSSWGCVTSGPFAVPPPSCSPLKTLPPPGAATGDPREPGEGGVGSFIKIRKPLRNGLILWEGSAALLFFELQKKLVREYKLENKCSPKNWKM